ncbi:amidase [Leucobacter sp. OH2974_COT-288]|nr:amidase [Leucobacter sp. OH2974_COT-288]
MTQATINLYEITITELLLAYRTRQLSPITVTARYLERIAAFDRAGKHLNSVIVMNEAALAAAAESERRWRDGTARPLEGVPFTVKDSYMVKGLTVASGSPAFAGLIANWDAFTVQQLLQAGAVLLGKTNMPPMADGGMQRGVYGRAENPYNTDYLAAAYASGSSNGSGAATAANLAVFGMGEETVSSGRSPASNNGLCAYTPSWGLISIRGNWPLFPARDVVVPHTRTMVDMLQLLNVLVVDDPETRGDFWRHQQVVELPPASAVRPADYTELSDPHALQGKVLAVPRMYLGKDPKFPMPVRPSVLALWEQTKARLEALGATVVESDFPVVEQYERDKPAGEQIAELGVLPEGWMATEFNHFLAFGWDDFLRANNDPEIPNLAVVDPDAIFPLAPGTLPDRYEEVPDYENRYRAVVKYAQEGIADPRDRADFAAGLRALVQLRTELFENWLAAQGYDAVVFPANADIGTEGAERLPAANDHAWLNGVLFSNGNYALRHFGIPTVTVSMGATSDIQVPVGVTFAGAAYSDSDLLRYAAALDGDGFIRPTPRHAPGVAADLLPVQQEETADLAVVVTATQAVAVAEGLEVEISGAVTLAGHAAGLAEVPLGVTVNEQTVAVNTGETGHFTARLIVARPEFGLNPDPGSLLAVVRVADSSLYRGAVSCEIAYVR